MNLWNNPGIASIFLMGKQKNKMVNLPARPYSEYSQLVIKSECDPDSGFREMSLATILSCSWLTVL